MLAQRLNAQIFANVPHRQWVFTIARRLRIYFLYDRSLLGKLCRAAYETLCQVVALELGDEEAVPAMVAAPQTFGDLANFNSHVHALVPEGARQFQTARRFALYIVCGPGQKHGFPSSRDAGRVVVDLCGVQGLAQ